MKTRPRFKSHPKDRRSGGFDLAILELVVKLIIHYTTAALLFSLTVRNIPVMSTLYNVILSDFNSLNKQMITTPFGGGFRTSTSLFVNLTQFYYSNAL